MATHYNMKTKNGGNHPILNGLMASEMTNKSLAPADALKTDGMIVNL